MLPDWVLKDFAAQFVNQRSNSVAGGIQSKLQGGSFSDGARTSFKYSALAYLNVKMQNEMIEQSKLDPRNDGTGLSQGMFGGLFKLAGGVGIHSRRRQAFNAVRSDAYKVVQVLYSG